MKDIMQTLNIHPTPSTPKIVFDNSNGIFEISGRSFPEDAIGFYRPVLDWIQAYLQNPYTTTILVFEMEYFNTASSKNFISILYSLNDLVNNGLDVKVFWRYHEDDEDTLEAGNDFASLVSIPFTFSVITV